MRNGAHDDDLVESMPKTISQILEAAYCKRQREHTGSIRNRALQIQSRSAVCIWHCAPVVQELVLAYLGNVRNREVPRHLRAVYRRGVGVFRASGSGDCFLNIFDLVVNGKSAKDSGMLRCFSCVFCVPRSLPRNVRQHATRVMLRTWQSLLLHGQW